MITVGGVVVLGAAVDAQTRCTHYSSELDVIAIRFRCCGDWYPCVHCHDEAVAHVRRTWPSQSSSELAVLCGVCATTMSIRDYRDSAGCPVCAAPFNPGCARHHALYFS